MSSQVNETEAYHVAWFVTSEALEDVTVRFVNGHLTNIERGRTIDAIDLGDVALVDGLVNAHTHLEFSDLTQPIPTMGRFTDWIRSVVAHRRSHSPDTATSIRNGLQESTRAGTTQIGEIATICWAWYDYTDNHFRGIVFQELLGLQPERITQQTALAVNHVQNTAHYDLAGLSPHAPYSTHLDLVDTAVRLSTQSGRPITMHLAETNSELELLSDRQGEFRELLTDFGLWQDEPSRFGRKPLDYLQKLALAPRSLVIHGNYLTDEEFQWMAKHPQMSLVYCPRTHAAFGHSEHPWRRAIELGVPVALGTDSRASNPDLSLFAELQFLAQRHTDLSHVELLQVGSRAGRVALGFDQSNTSDFTLIRLINDDTKSGQPNLFAAENQVCGMMTAGRWNWLDADCTQIE